MSNLPLLADARPRLLRLLAQRSYQKRKVVLASGRESDFYIDCKQTTLHHEGAALTGASFVELLIADEARGRKFTAVAGPTLGADPIVSAIAAIGYLYERSWPAVIVRKEPKAHGTGRWLEGVQHLPAGASLAMIEDVVTTGGSMLKAVEHAREAGFIVEHCYAIVDRLEGGRDAVEAAGCSLTTLFTREDFNGSAIGDRTAP